MFPIHRAFTGTDVSHGENHRPGRNPPSPRPEAQLLGRHAAECGVQATISGYPVPTHAFHVFWSFLPEARQAIDEVSRFIRELTTPGRAASGQTG